MAKPTARKILKGACLECGKPTETIGGIHWDLCHACEEAEARRKRIRARLAGTGLYPELGPLNRKVAP